MESRIQFLLRQTVGVSLLLSAIVVVAGFGVTNAHAADAKDIELDALVVREPERREVRINRLDNENFEIGAYTGVISIEDFGSNLVYGARVAYHISEDFFAEAAYGASRLGQTSFEELSGGSPLLTDAERDFSFYNAGVGYNILPGETFFGKNLAVKGGLFLIAGIGSTEFGGDDRFTINAGLGYRLIARDWLAIRLDVRDHAFRSDLLGSNEVRHNIEVSGGLTVFF